MSKMGKKIIIFQTSSFSAPSSELISYNETYNPNLNAYSGDFLLNKQNALTITSNNLESFNYSVDTHYDELKEIKNIENGENEETKLANLSDLNLHTFRSKLEYNFLIENFEENIKKLQINSLRVPNFYDVVESLSLTGQYKNSDGTSYLEDPANFLSIQESNEFKVNIIPSKILVGKKYVPLDKYIKNFNPFKEEFPYYSDITFTTHEKVKNNLSDLFHEYDLYSYIFDKLSKSNITQKVFVNSQDTSTTAKVLIFDQSFINTILSQRIDLQTSFIFEINKRVDSKARNFSEIVNNYQEYSEVIGYHLKKYEGLANPSLTQKPTPIQEWYIPNISEDDFELIDSQLIYDSRYTYTLDPIVLTFSSVCTISAQPQVNDYIKYVFTRKPVIKIFDIDRIGVSYSNYLKDSPPTEPEIEFIPYIGVPNKIKINLNTSIGLKTIKPVNFSSAEENKNNLLMEAQNKLVSDNLLTYQSDEPSDFFEIYRLIDKPSSYQDFANNILVTIPTNGAAGASFEDTVTQNRKHYYIARSIDYHKNISNPTVMYEVEIVNDNGLIIPNINVVDFKSNDEAGYYEKEIKRYFKIKPSLRHTILEDENFSPKNVQLGTKEETVWDSKFKIRVTSKSNGKKMDIYVTFIYKNQDS